MIELFIALFGGLYYLIRYVIDKSKGREFDREVEKREIIRKKIESKYVADYDLMSWVRNLAENRNNYDKVCKILEDDFRFVLGDGWRTSLLRLRYDLYTYWAYHLLLAKKGKIDNFVPFSGYIVGGIDEKDIDVKFAERIEQLLVKSGANDIRLVLELSNGTTPYNFCGADIKIESLCVYKTHRLW